VTATRAPVIDCHAHILVPDVFEVTAPHSMFVKSFADPGLSAEAKRNAKERTDFVLHRMSDVVERIDHMDQMGVDIQLLSSSLVHQCSYFAEPAESLRLERILNDHIAGVVAARPSRFVGLGGVPLHAPELAAPELRRCTLELGLKGVAISTMARDLEIGERALWPFWEQAEALGAVVYVHPAGNTGPRFQKFHLWNSIGQNFEEAMAIASLLYEGVLDAFPKLRICVSHGGGYLPLSLGRVVRNYVEKPSTRANMTKSPAEYLRMLYYDSCVYEPQVLRHLIERVGADRVVLGSDYPVGETKPVEFVRDATGIDAADQDRIIRTNAATLLGLVT
jgi:aminocarboxymuconate-semialdehyde decarboxylase